MLSFVVLLASGVALCSACCTPAKWEGVQAAIGGYAGRRRHGLIKEYVAVAYDGENNRTAAFIDYHNGEYSNKFKVVTKYENDEGKLYVLDLKKDKCWTKSLERPFRKACTPSDAKSVGSYFLGLKEGFKVTGYEIRGRGVNAFISVEELDNNQCIPVTEAVYGRLPKADFIQTIGFINISLGIKNETVFEVPKRCEKREEFSLAEELTRDYYILAV